MTTQSAKLKVQNQDLELKIIADLISKEIAFHQLPEEMTEREKAEMRRKALEKISKADLLSLGEYSFDAEIAGKRNCENLIGGVSVPVGIAGPLLIKGKYAKGEFYLPLATTEGALAASVNRGCKAISLAGGAETVVEDVGISRAPVFKISSKCKAQSAKPKFNMKNSKQFVGWVRENFERIKGICEATSHHLRLLKIEPFVEKDAVFLRFSFKTGLAMGMNMATIAASKAGLMIEKETGAKLISLSGNVCCDKKASILNYKLGRGKKVWARVRLTGEILKKVLKTTAKEFYEVYRLKIVLGSKVAGTIGANAQMANIIAAIFLATGQDLAHVTEGAIGKTECTLIKDEGIEIKVYLPDLPIGVVGGGTGLTTQKSCLGVMGFSGKLENDCLKLAEIIGSAVLAGEISLIAALASGDLAKAHERLGRGK